MDSIKALVQPITHKLPAPVRDLGISLIGPACYRSILLDVDLADTQCLKLAASKGLGIGIVAASAVVKVPQIIKLVASRSASGVSFLSYLLETTAYLITLAYNVRNGFPFSTYGETALIMGQNVAICLLVLHYGGRPALAAAFLAALAAAAAALFAPAIVDMPSLGYLQAGAGVLGVASKVPQILAIWAQGGTGQLSAFAVFNYLIGSLTRIFTTLQEVDDKLILYGFVSGFVLNAVLALQMVLYWNVKPASAGAKTKIKTKASKTPAVAAAATQPRPDEVASASAVPPRKGPTTRRRG